VETTRRRGVPRLALTSVLLLLLACSCRAVALPPPPAPELDLLGQGWGSVAGVSSQADGLHVEATGGWIVGQDGSGGQPDPPVDLAGTHLRAGPGFTLRATFADVTGDASWAVHDRPPVTADEFRIEPPGLVLTLRDDDVQVTVRDGWSDPDGAAAEPVLDRHVQVADPTAALTLTSTADLLTVASGGQTLVTLPAGEVFTSGRLWFGFSSEEGRFRVSSFTAAAPAGAELSAVQGTDLQVPGDPDGLQALADRVRPGFGIGAAVALGPLVADPEYARAALSDFGSVTPENAMKAQFLHPRPDVWTFGEADAVVDLALRHGRTVHGHALAFAEALPRWMQELPTASVAEREASGQVLLDHVRTVVGHFRGRVDSWDVVNEPFDVDQGTDLQRSVWYRVFGPGYPAVVSRAVHDADPDVRQFVNENGADVAGPRQDALLDLVQEANAQGGHIAGVGLQAHVYDLDTDAVSTAELAASLDRFAAAGLQVRISENDVTDDEGAAAQAEQYADVLRACLQAPNCVSYTTWGVDDRYDWFLDDDGEVRQGHDLLYDDGRPTAAHEALRSVLGG
jgi:endo-1,4-beta-xylanase